jgi:hypothetical protein
MTQTESDNSGSKSLSTDKAEQNAQVVSQEFVSIDNRIFDSAVSKSANIWGRYGTSGGSLVLGGAIAILGVVATVLSVPKWNVDDLAGFLSFASLLIVLGTGASLLFRSMDERRQQERVQLYGLVKEAIVQMHKDDVKALTDAVPQQENGAAPRRFSD